METGDREDRRDDQQHEEDPGGGPRVAKTQSHSIPGRSAGRRRLGGSRRIAPTPAAATRLPSRRSSRPASWRRASGTATLRLGAARCRAAAGLPAAGQERVRPDAPAAYAQKMSRQRTVDRGRPRRRCSATHGPRRDPAEMADDRERERQGDRGELVEERLDCVDEPGHRHILAATASTIGGPWRPTRQPHRPPKSARRRVSRRAPTLPAPDGARSARLRDHARVVPAPPADQARAGPHGANDGDRARRSPRSSPKAASRSSAGPRMPASSTDAAPPTRGSSTCGSARRGEDLRPRLPEPRFRAGGSPARNRRPRGLTPHKPGLTRGPIRPIDAAISMGVGGQGGCRALRRCCALSPRLTTFLGLLAAALTALLLTAGTASAAIAPPCAARPVPDVAGTFSDRSQPFPTTRTEASPHPLLRDRVHARQHRRSERRPHDRRALRQVCTRPRQVSRRHQRADMKSQRRTTPRTGRRSAATARRS